MNDDFKDNQEPNDEKQDNDDLNNMDELNSLIGDKPINRQVQIIKPVRPSDRGFHEKSEVVKESKRGIDIIRFNSCIIAVCGKVIKGHQIAGRCDVCGGYECCNEHLFNCFKQGCRKSLCLRHVRFLEVEPGKNVPFCPEHYFEAVNDFDTWGFAKKSKIIKLSREL